MRNTYRSLLAFLLLVFLSVPANGQFVVDDVNSGFFRGLQTYTSTDPLPNYASLANLNGNFVTWDFTQYGYELERDFFTDAQDVDASTTQFPSVSTFVNLGANTVEITEVDDNLVYQYLKVTDAEVRYVGSVTEFDGGTGEIQYDPGRLDYDVPFTYQDSWTSTSTQTVGGLSSTVTKSVEVVGNGTVITPFGTFQALQLESEITVNGTTTRQVEWISERLLDFSAVIYFDENDNVDDVDLIFFEDAGEIFRMGPGSQGAFIDYDDGFRIEVTQAPSTEGTLGLARYDRAPGGSTFDGNSAQSSDGSTVTPDVIWDEYYFSLTNIGLENFEIQACFRLENINRNPDVGGINDIGKLVVVRRSGPGDPWDALDTTVDDSTPIEKLCVDGVTSFSQFAIGGEESINPLPVELTAFTATADGADAVLTWQTASETNNAGFHVEQRAVQTSRQDGSTWESLGFVEGAGTTAEPQDYRFRAETVGYGEQAFRLRQVDTDGTESRSDVQTVRITPTEAVAVSAYPNPFGNGQPARITVTPREAQQVTVDVFDLLGRRVARLHDGRLNAGEATMLTLSGAQHASGVYVLRVVGEQFQTTTRLTLVR